MKGVVGRIIHLAHGLAGVVHGEYAHKRIRLEAVRSGERIK
jgi:hypothetical protein